jgi:hypothetical protein
LSEISLAHTHAVAGTVTVREKNPFIIHEMNGNSSSSIFSILFEVYNLLRFRVQKEDGERKQDGNMKKNEHHP